MHMPEEIGETGNLHVLETTEILDYLDNSFIIMGLLENIRLISNSSHFKLNIKPFFLSFPLVLTLR